jgi:hypothetical protein
MPDEGAEPLRPGHGLTKLLQEALHRLAVALYLRVGDLLGVLLFLAGGGEALVVQECCVGCERLDVEAREPAGLVALFVGLYEVEDEACPGAGKRFYSVVGPDGVASLDSVEDDSSFSLTTE